MHQLLRFAANQPHSVEFQGPTQACPTTAIRIRCAAQRRFRPMLFQTAVLIFIVVCAKYGQAVCVASQAACRSTSIRTWRPGTRQLDLLSYRLHAVAKMQSVAKIHADHHRSSYIRSVNALYHVVTLSISVCSQIRTTLSEPLHN